MLRITILILLTVFVLLARVTTATESVGKGTKTRDSWLDEDATSTNYGTSIDAEIGNRSGGAGEKIFWIAFVDIAETVDATNPGNGQRVDSVRIRLYISSSANNVVVNVRECLRVPVEGEITWDDWKASNTWTTAGAKSDNNDYEATPILSTYTVQSDDAGYTDWWGRVGTADTALVRLAQQWIDGDINDTAGVFFEMVDSNDSMTIHTREKSPSTRQPEITVWHRTVRTVMTGTTDNEDAEIDMGNPNTNKGSATTASISTGGIATYLRYWSRWNNIDVAVGANQTITSCTLRVYASQKSGSSTISVYRILLDNIIESEITWDSSTVGCPSCAAWGDPGADLNGTDYDNTVLDAITTSTTGWKEFDVTNQVKQWYSGNHFEGGFILWNPSSFTSMTIHTSENGSNKPQLIINHGNYRPEIHGTQIHGATR